MKPTTYKKNDLHIEDVALRDLAEKYGTPLYCYSAARITENFKAYHDAFRRVTDEKNFLICYATKANSNQSVITLLRKLGAGGDVVSGGEFKRARAAGIPASKIVYSGVGKTAAEIEHAVREGIMQINVESEPELALISGIAKRLKKTVDVAIRINPDVDAKTHKKITTGTKENKFGIDLAKAPALYDRAAKLPNIRLSGVAVHIGSQLTSLAPYKKAYTRLADLVRVLRKRGHDITTVDIGGGIGITYKDETPPDLNLYALMVRDIILTLGVKIIMEPGRSLVGDAGVLLTRVLNVKKGDHKTFIILDAAMNDLVRPAMYDAYHAILPCTKSAARKISCDIVGPVCETGDTFHIDEKIQPLQTGDLAVLMCAGAYGAVMSSAYNTRPPAGEVLVSGKKHARIRKPQTVEDIIGNDLVPEWAA
jgi:diaminopimelate decarboxylase